MVASVVFRLLAWALALWLILFAEPRASPSLPDALLPHIPYVEWIARYNYVLWLAGYVPIALWLGWLDSKRFIRYMISSGLLAIVRAVCILATGLGPVHGADVNAGMTDETRIAAFWQLVTPAGLFAPDGVARVYLTKDLFFSGHTATTFLLLLYVWPYAKARWAMLAAHVLVVASVFFAHLHYTIDVLGAYAVTFTLFALREWKVGDLLREK